MVVGVRLLGRWEWWGWRGLAVTGEAGHWVCWEGGPTRRVRRLLLAMVVEGPALPDRGFSGVLAPVVEVEMGGRRLPTVGLSREGRVGSMAMVPSFWRSRILRSRRLICRSSWVMLLIECKVEWRGAGTHEYANLGT